MYLADTNVFLEILLSQEKREECKKILSNHMGDISLTDFSLHSIGVILFRHGMGEIFKEFSNDVLPKVNLITLSKASYKELPAILKMYGLDFDDAYQFKVAIENDFEIITLDKDFEKVKGKIKIKTL
ncbi:MAG: PIN domain-containing protein [Nitrospinae bacterium]|nr:PIN domain-containing protein [Nitrospinota bacterium]